MTKTNYVTDNMTDIQLIYYPDYGTTLKMET